MTAIADALTTILAAIAAAKTAEDVTSDKVALAVLTDIENRIAAIQAASRELEQNVTLDHYAALQEQLNAAFRALGNLQAVAATAGTRRGGYKGSTTTNASRSLSDDQRARINSDFQRARADGLSKEHSYAQVARHHRLSGRTIRRVVNGQR
jgi:hypothetical protein